MPPFVLPSPELDETECPDCGYVDCKCRRVDVDDYIIADADERRGYLADLAYDDR